MSDISHIKQLRKEVRMNWMKIVKCFKYCVHWYRLILISRSRILWVGIICKIWLKDMSSDIWYQSDPRCPALAIWRLSTMRWDRHYSHSTMTLKIKMMIQKVREVNPTVTIVTFFTLRTGKLQWKRCEKSIRTTVTTSLWTVFTSGCLSAVSPNTSRLTGLFC